MMCEYLLHDGKCQPTFFYNVALAIKLIVKYKLPSFLVVLSILDPQANFLHLRVQTEGMAQRTGSTLIDRKSVV